MRLRFLACCIAASCATPPSAPGPTPPPPPSSPPSLDASPPPARDAGATPACRARDAAATKLLGDLADWLRNPEAGALRRDHADLFRVFPGLHESGVVLSIAPTHGTGPSGPIFAVTFVPRGGTEAHLAFASPACEGGDLAFVGSPTRLGVEDATLRYATRVPVARAMTELQIDRADARKGIGPVESRGHDSVLVEGSRIVGILPLDREIAPEDGVRRRDVHLFGSGWYPQGDGAAYMLVHRVELDPGDLCVKKKVVPNTKPELRLVARIDRDGAFTTDETKLGSAFALAIGNNQPPEGLRTCRAGPTAVGGGGIAQGPPAQWICGLFASADDARKAAAGTVVTTEPRAGQAAPREPWRLDVRFTSPTPRVHDCYF